MVLMHPRLIDASHEVWCVAVDLGYTFTVHSRILFSLHDLSSVCHINAVKSPERVYTDLYRLEKLSTLIKTQTGSPLVLSIRKAVIGRE
jgi:hypothetical protein